MTYRQYHVAEEKICRRDDWYKPGGFGRGEQAQLAFVAFYLDDRRHLYGVAIDVGGA